MSETLVSINSPLRHYLLELPKLITCINLIMQWIIIQSSIKTFSFFRIYYYRNTARHNDIISLNCRLTWHTHPDIYIPLSSWIRHQKLLVNVMVYGKRRMTNYLGHTGSITFIINKLINRSTPIFRVKIFNFIK